MCEVQEQPSVEGSLRPCLLDDSTRNVNRNLKQLGDFVTLAFSDISVLSLRKFKVNSWAHVNLTAEEVS
jgi:hypothetical protein